VDLLAEFSFCIVYCPGVKAVYPDGLSRPGRDNKGEKNDLIQALPSINFDSNIQSSLTPMLWAIISVLSMEGGDNDNSPLDTMLSVNSIITGQSANKDLEQVRLALKGWKVTPRYQV
jgi:hypothetical protein